MQVESFVHKSTLILGRHFFMTAKIKIDVYTSTLSIEFGDDIVLFNIFEAMNHLVEGQSNLYDHSIFMYDVVKLKKQ